MISVVVPVGPEEHHCRWLAECLDSIGSQMLPPREILLVDDMHDLARHDPWILDMIGDPDIRIYRPPWRLGVGAAFNAGIAEARSDAVFMLGADDRMLPRCLERCLLAYEENDRRDAYYSVTIRYDDGREQPLQDLPCNEAMVTKGLWQLTGGFPPESAVGAPDAALISIMLRHMPERLVRVEPQSEPLVEYRVHGESDTAARGPWQGAILAARDVLTSAWRQPTWGRYE
jgi:glycosyltransferase involved in cell wall biosynthesis